MSNAQARMLVHEKALMTQMNKTLLPGISVTPTAGSAQESAERSGASTSSSTEPPSSDPGLSLLLLTVHCLMKTGL
jgi:hypothetical protein